MNFPEKRIIIGIALAAVLPFQAFGQNDSLMNIKPQGSELRIEAAGFGITLGNNENAGFHYPYSPGKHRQARVSTSLGIASIDFGFNILNGVSYYGPWSGLGDFLDMSGGKSIRLAWEPAAVDIALDSRGCVSLIAGIRLSADNYMFSEPYTLRPDGAGQLMPEKLEGYIKKSKMTAAYIGIPVKLSFRLARTVYLTGYASWDLLLNAHTKYKKPKTKDNLPGISPWKVSAGGCLSVSNIGIYCDYGITPLFKDGTGADAHTISVGIRFGI